VPDDGRRARIMAAVTEHDTATGVGALVAADIARNAVLYQPYASEAQVCRSCWRRSARTGS
jgi:hypothetical protein